MGKKRTTFINLPLPDKDNRLREDVDRIQQGFKNIDEEFRNQYLGEVLGDKSLARHLRRRNNVEEVSQEVIIANTDEFKAFAQNKKLDLQQDYNNYQQDLEDAKNIKKLELEALSVIKKNELLNSDFKINSRGSSSYQFTSNKKYGYSLDRWFYRTNSINFNTIISKTSEGVNISNNQNQNGSVTQFGQLLPYLIKYKSRSVSILINIKANKNIDVQFKTKAIISDSEEIDISSNTLSLTNSYQELKLNNININFDNIQNLTDNSCLFAALELPSDVYTIDIKYIKLEVSQFCTDYTHPDYQLESYLCSKYFNYKNFLSRAVQTNIYGIDIPKTIKPPIINIYSDYDLGGSLDKVTNVDVNGYEFSILTKILKNNLIEKITLQSYASNDAYYKGSVSIDSEFYYFNI